MSGERRLSKRLQAVADLVRPGSVADVGTDHGYMAVYLLQKGIATDVTATDIHEGPLAAARATAAAQGLEGQIRFVLCDGLTGCAPADTVVIAGMGGETIAHILQNAPWTKSGAHLILQPQSKQDVLTQWLHDNGYRILDARLVEDEGRLYTVFVAQGGPPRPIAGPEELYVNRLLVEKRDPLLPAYTAFLMERLERAYRGLEKAAVPRPAEQARLKSILHGLKAIKQEADKW